MTQASTELPPGQRADTELAVDVRVLRCRYGDFEAVRGVDLEVRRGEIFALLGTNGAGKTTTLEVLEGFHRRHAGQVRVLGHDPWTDREAMRPRMGIMLQEGGFIGELTVTETLRLWQRLVTRIDDPERLLDRFELAHRRQVRVASLSGGEKRRLDLAMALWGTPELAILDEPTTGLDPESRRRAWDAIHELREAGLTVLLTTHYLEEAEELADRLAIMHEGRVAVTGTLAEIVASRPARFSARLRHAPVGLPDLAGELELRETDDGWLLTVATTELQADLTRVLGWAADRDEELHDLRAAPASLAEVYHSLRATTEAEEAGSTP